MDDVRIVVSGIRKQYRGVIVPSVASTVMISPAKTFDQSPPQWVGAAVLLSYGVVTALAGTALLRRRDIS
jgi:ABC-2 type transport system permease protein